MDEEREHRSWYLSRFVYTREADTNASLELATSGQEVFFKIQFSDSIPTKYAPPCSFTEP